MLEMLRVGSRAAVVLAIAGIVSVSGCYTSPSPTVKITVDYPGASPAIVDDLIATALWQQIMGMEGLSSMILVSSQGRAEVYLHGSPGGDAVLFAQLAEGRTQLAVPAFPNGARLRGVADVSRTPFPPVVGIRDVDHADFRLIRDRMASLGISVASVTEALSDAFGKEGASGQSAANLKKRLKELTVKSSDGKTYHIPDFVEIRIVREPDHCIRRWP
jgi:multidrug efflux pump subunit AcrB